jgi:hypothetical protein
LAHDCRQREDPVDKILLTISFSEGKLEGGTVVKP